MTEKVVDSWVIVTSLPNYEVVAGEKLFRHVFTIDSSLQGVFGFTQGYDYMSDELFASERFKKHARAVISTFNAAVSMLGPDLSPLIRKLRNLGQRHLRYKAQPEHFAIIGRALIETLSELMGDAFTDDVKKAWQGIYNTISSLMIDGIELEAAKTKA